MIFLYKYWDDFCKALVDAGIKSIPAKAVYSTKGSYIVLKHDVETNVSRALQLAQIEKKYGHIGTYYVQAYLLDSEENVTMLKSMQKMGHEISYHYDVMDSCKGDIKAAINEFEKNIAKFEKNGFIIKTLCQHGNPVVDRVGYTSNRDFFRNPNVQERYPDYSDIMVDFPQKANTEYLYYSDAGRKFKLIYDPFTNDIVNSNDKNIQFEDLKSMLAYIKESKKSAIISTHPHRWSKSALAYKLKEIMFKVIKSVAKIMMRVPILKKIMSRYYYLAKKI